MAVGQLRVGEIILAEQVNVRPGHGGVSFDVTTHPPVAIRQ